MNCKNCGNQVNENMKFCAACGTPVEAPVAQTVEQPVQPVMPQSVDQPAMVQPQVQPMQQPMGQQPMNNGMQPMYNQPMSYQPMPENKKSNNWVIVIVIIAVLLIVGGIGYALANNSSKDKESNTNTTEEKQRVDNDEEEDYEDYEEDDEEENEPTTPSYTGTEVTFKGYKLNIPSSDYTYKVTDSNIQLTGTDNKTVVGLQIITSNFDTLKSNTATLQSTIKSSGYSVSTIQYTTSYGGVEMLTASVKNSTGTNMVMAYVKIDSSTVMVVAIGNVSNTADYSQLYKIANIAKTVRKA